MTRCATHKNARAAWVCGSCELTLCPDCAYSRSLHNQDTIICIHCGGLGRLITRPRRVAPFWEMFPRFLKAIFSSAGLVQLLAIAVVMFLAGWVPLLGSPIAGFIYISYFFRVISSAAAGAEKLPEPDDFLGFWSIIGPVFRFTLATVLIWLPAMIYLVWGIGPEALMQDPESALRSPVLVLLLVAGLLYFPAAILTAAIAESALAMLNPAITVRLILRIPGQYALASAICGMLMVANFVVMNALELASVSFNIPLVTPILLLMLRMVVPVFVGFILGRLIYQNHADFGVMRAGESEEAEWPDAKARGRVDLQAHVRTAALLPSAPSVPTSSPSGLELDTADVPLPPAFEPSGLELDLGSFAPPAPPLLDPSALSVAAPEAFALDKDGNLVPLDEPRPRPRPPVPKPVSGTLDLADEVPLLHIGKKKAPTSDLPAPKRDELTLLRAALDKGDDKAVEVLFRATSNTGAYPDLEPRQNLRLATILERSGQFEEAVRACQRAAKSDLKGPFAAKAIFTAARIMSERAHNPSGGRAMYEFLLKSFPDDELATRAREALARLT